MRRAAIVHAAAAVLGLGAASAHAQPRARTDPGRDGALPRAYISVNGGAQMTRSDFTTTLAFPIYGEEATVESRHDVPAGPLIDVGGGIRIVSGLAVGAAVTRYQQRGSASLDARIPHPLRPQQLRPLADTVADLDRAETAVHAQLAWLVPVTGQVTMAVFGGPSVFRVEQDLVSGLDLREEYPFDEVSLERAHTVTRKDTTVGFNVGTDIVFRIKERFGVGGIVRYSRGTLDIDAAGDSASLDAGGLQLSGGLRWVF